MHAVSIGKVLTTVFVFTAGACVLLEQRPNQPLFDDNPFLGCDQRPEARQTIVLMSQSRCFSNVAGTQLCQVCELLGIHCLLSTTLVSRVKGIEPCFTETGFIAAVEGGA